MKIHNVFLSGNAVRAKWKTLRDTFRKELQKKPRPRSGDDGAHASWKSSWKHFETLVFLLDQFTARCSSGSLPEVTTDSVDSEVADNDAPNPDDSDVPSVVPSSPSVNISADPATRKRKRPTDEIGNALIRLEQRKVELMENNTLSQPKIDDDEAFFNSLLPHVRPLPQAQKLLLRIKIQQLVYDCISSTTQSDQFQVSEPASRNPYSASSTQQCSNPPSVASYFSGYSEENTYDNL